MFFYLEDRERTLDSAMDKVMLSLTNFAAEMEREQARQRTYDAMVRKAQALHVTGGKVYGYNNVELLGPDGSRVCVTRRINPDQAAMVRRIFEMYAGGVGTLTIAHRLNDERVKSPRGRGWAPSAVREMLYRPIYRGEVVRNRRQKTVRGGTKKRSRNSLMRARIMRHRRRRLSPSSRRSSASSTGWWTRWRMAHFPPTRLGHA